MKFVKFLFLIFLAFILYFAYCGFQFYGVPNRIPADTIKIDIPPGSHLAKLKTELSKQGIEVDPLLFKIWTKIKGAKLQLQTGEFEISSAHPTGVLLDKILTARPIQYRFIIKEGHNVFDFLETVKSLEISDSEKAKIPSYLKDSTQLKSLGIYPEGEFQDKERFWLEGFLFPETYTYHKYDTAKSLVESILSQFQKRVLPEIQNHPWSSTPEGKYKLLSLASIVEKESGLFDEQPLIASVFWNRINKRMRLQSDPTTIYGLLPHFDGNLKRIHLTSPSEYNTYTLAGLPRGPIANPGVKAIQAVLNPKDSRFLYFVAKGDGTHVFSEDLKTHNQNVRYYQIEMRRKLKKP